MTDGIDIDKAHAKQPRKGWGVTQTVREFFERNPDEELTYPDLMAKFDLTDDVARSMVQQLKAEGLIESVHVIRNRAKGRAG